MSLEDPTVPLSLADDEDAYPHRSRAGVTVNRKTALGLSAVWRGVNLISGDVGRHELRVYRYPPGGGGGLLEDPRHQAARVMRRPNDYMTPFTFRQTLQAHALLAGNGYAYIVRDTMGQPLELLPLDPDRVWPVRANGLLWYVAEVDDPVPGRRRNQKSQVKLPCTDVLHIKGLGFDGLCGYRVIDVLCGVVGLALAGREYGARFFEADGSPGIVLQVPMGMKDTAVANLRKTWKDMHRGVKNAHKIGILYDGVTIGSFARPSARDAQLLESRQFDTLEIANVLGVPPHKLGDPSKTAYNSLESENQSYLDDTLDRWFIAWQQECDAKLLTEEEKASETHTCRFDNRSLARVSLAARGTYYSQAITGGWMSRDEVRGLENLNPIPGGKGTEFVLPVNVAPAPAPATPPADPAAQSQPAQASAALLAAMRAVARDAARRFLVRHRAKADKAFRGEPAKFGDWLAGWTGGTVDDAASELAPVVEMARSTTSKTDPAEFALSLCRLAAAEFARAAKTGDLLDSFDVQAVADAAANALFPES